MAFVKNFFFFFLRTQGDLGWVELGGKLLPQALPMLNAIICSGKWLLLNFLWSTLLPSFGNHLSLSTTTTSFCLSFRMSSFCHCSSVNIPQGINVVSSSHNNLFLAIGEIVLQSYVDVFRPSSITKHCHFCYVILAFLAFNSMSHLVHSTFDRVLFHIMVSFTSLHSKLQTSSDFYLKFEGRC